VDRFTRESRPILNGTAQRNGFAADGPARGDRGVLAGIDRQAVVAAAVELIEHEKTLVTGAARSGDRGDTAMSV